MVGLYYLTHFGSDSLKLHIISSISSETVNSKMVKNGHFQIFLVLR